MYTRCYNHNSGQKSLGKNMLYQFNIQYFTKRKRNQANEKEATEKFSFQRNCSVLSLRQWDSEVILY